MFQHSAAFIAVAQCEPGTVYCLTTGRCVSKEPVEERPCMETQPSYSSSEGPSEWMENCPPGTVYCLTTGRCVSKEPVEERPCMETQPSYSSSVAGSSEGPSGWMENCPPGTVYCLTAGRCVSKDPSNEGECDDSIYSTSSDYSSGGDSVMSSGEWINRCPPGQVYCLTTGLCVWKEPEPNCDCRCDEWTSWCSWSSSGDPDLCSSSSDSSRIRSSSEYSSSFSSSSSSEFSSSSSSEFSSSSSSEVSSSSSSESSSSSDSSSPNLGFSSSSSSESSLSSDSSSPNLGFSSSGSSESSSSSDLGQSSSSSSSESSPSSGYSSSDLGLSSSHSSSESSSSSDSSSSGDGSSSTSSSDDSSNSEHHGECPVVLGPVIDAQCDDLCQADSDCEDTEKCCAGAWGCKLCLSPDIFELPLLCPDPRSEHREWFQDFITYGINTAFVGNVANLRLGVQFPDSFTNNTFTVLAAQTDVTSRVIDWQEMFEGIQADTMLKFTYPKESPEEGIYPTTIALTDEQSTVSRIYPTNFLHFPFNPKPEIILRNEASLTIDEGSTYDMDPLMSFIEITDEEPEGTFPVGYEETTRTTSLEDCQNAYNEYMSAASGGSRLGVYVIPSPLPRQTSDVTWQLQVSRTAERRKRQVVEERVVSPMGGVIYMDEKLQIIPSPGWSGTLNFKLWPLDGADDPELQRLMTTRWNPNTAMDRQLLLERSPHVGDSEILTLEVTPVNDPPELLTRFLTALDLGTMDLMADIPPRHVSHDLEENAGFPARRLVRKVFQDEDSEDIGLALVMGEGEAGTYQWKASETSDWQDMELSTSDEVHRLLMPESVAATWKRVVEEEGARESFEQSCSYDTNLAQAKLLPLDAWIRFVPDQDDLTVASHFAFTAYDPDSIENMDTVTWPLEKSLCVPLCLHSSLCAGLAKAIVPGSLQRVGCDGQPGSGRQLDACGVCGGDGQTCTHDCYGTLNGAANEVCGICVGGLTGLPVDEGKDCRGICGSSHVLKDVKLYNKDDPTGTDHTKKMCLREDMDPNEFALERFCDGFVGSPAKLDECGVCYGGLSGMEANSTLDVCAVCDGDGTECVDCAGVANGDSMLDTCDECLLLGDTQRDTSCVSLGTFSKRLVWLKQSEEVFVGGANLDSLGDVIDGCNLVLYEDNEEASPSVSVPLDSVSVEWVTTATAQRQLKFMTPANDEALQTGSYKLSCTFSGTGTSQTKVSTGFLLLFDNLDLTAITPDTFDIGQVSSGQVTGNGKIWRGMAVYLKCPTDWKKYSIPDCLSNTMSLPGSDFDFVELPVTLNLGSEDLTDLDFPLPLTPLMTEKMTVGMSVEIVAFFTKPRLPEQVEQAVPLTINIQGRIPTVVALGFTDTLCGLWVEFDMNIAVGGGGACQRGQTASVLRQCCSQIFHQATVDKLGTGAKCFTDASMVGVALTEDHSVSSGEILQFSNGGLQQQGVQSTMALYADHTLTYALPTEQHVPTVEVFAPSSVGSCSPIQLSIKAGGATGCWRSRIQYSVSVEFADPNSLQLPADEPVITQLETLNTELEAQTDKPAINILQHQLSEGFAYNFTVRVTNVMGTQSETVITTVNKVAEEKAVDFLLSGRRFVKPTDYMHIQSIVRATSCFKSRIQRYTYTYTVENSGEINLDKYENARKFRISPLDEDGSYRFRGGSVYRIVGQVLIELKTGETHTEEARLSVTVEEIPIQVSIASLAERWSTAQDFTLDGSQSLDHSNPYSQALYVYVWDCEMVDSVTSDTTCYGNWNGETDVALSSINLGYTAVLDIPADTLSTGKYNFTLTVLSHSREASTSIVVTIIDGDPPKAFIKAPDVVNPQEAMRIDAQVCSGTVTYMSWSAVSSNGLNLLDLDASCESKLARYKSANIECVFFPLICKDMEMDSVYEFELRAQNEDTGSYQVVSTTVTTASPPDITQLTVEPSSGIAFETVFTISVSTVTTEPLLYSFYYMVDNRRNSLSNREAVDSIQVPLTAGELTIYVVVCSSSSGMCTEAVSQVITVSANEISSLAVNDVEEFIAGTANPLDFLHVLLQSGLDLENGVDSDGIALSQDFVTYVIDQIMALSMNELLSVPVDDLEMAFSLIKDVIQIIPGVNLPDNLRTVLLDLTNTFSLIQADEASGTRRKRAVEDDTAPVATTSQIEALLNIFHVLMRNTLDTALDPSGTETYLDYVDSYMVGLCNSLIFEQSVLTAQSEIGCIGTEWKAFDNVHTESFSIGNCSAVNINGNSIVLGAHARDSYTQWDCTNEEQCEGACVATYQSPRDTYTVTSPQVVPLLTTRRSDITDVQLVNPKTGMAVEVGELESPVMYTLQLQGEVNLTAYSLVCRQFVLGDWSEETCNISSEVSTASTEVVCACNSLAPTALFETEPLEQDTADTTPEDSTTVTQAGDEMTIQDENDGSATEVSSSEPVTVSMPSSAVSVQTVFSFTTDYSTVINSGEGEAAFITALNSQLGEVMNVHTDRIRDTAISNGQDVSFLILAGESGETDLSAALSELQHQTILGTFVVEAPVGTPLYILVDSFSATAITTTVQPQTTANSAVSRSNLPLIIGCAVGGVLLLVIVVLIVALLWMKSKSNRPKSVSPEPRYSNQATAQPYITSAGVTQSPPPSYEDMIYERKSLSRNSMNASLGEPSDYGGLAAV